MRIRVIRVKDSLDRLLAWGKRRRATALRDADARINAKVDLKVFHRQFRHADFAVNNLRLQDGKQ